MLEVVPVLPFIANVTIGAGALFYAGQLNITVVADRDTVPTSTPSPPPGDVGPWRDRRAPQTMKPPGAARRGREAGRRWLR